MNAKQQKLLPSVKEKNDAAKEKNDAIKIALKRVEIEVRERRIRSSPCAKTNARSKSSVTHRSSSASISAKNQGPCTKASIDYHVLNRSLGSKPSSIKCRPLSPLSDVTNFSVMPLTLQDHPKQNDELPDVIKRHEQACPKQNHKSKLLDPQKEWELAPLKEALKMFAQSDKIFQRPASPLRLPVRGKEVKYMSSCRQTTPVLNSRKHSIMALLQSLYPPASGNTTTTRSSTAPYRVGCNLPAGVNVAAQTQTDDTNKYVDKAMFHGSESCTSRDFGCDVKPQSSEDYEGQTQINDTNSKDLNIGFSSHGMQINAGDKMFLSYDSNSDVKANSFEHDGSTFQKSRDLPVSSIKKTGDQKANSADSFPSYDSISTSRGERAPEGEFLHTNKKGCAWVFNFNGDAQSDTRLAKEKRADPTNASVSESVGCVGVRDVETSVAYDSDEYCNSSFLSETITQHC